MFKKILGISLLFSVLLFAGCDRSELSANVLKSVVDEGAVGIVMNSKTSDVQDLVKHVDKPSDYQTVVLLSSTGFKSGDAAGFVYSEPLDSSTKISFDEKNIENLKKVGLFQDLKKVSKGSYWNSVVINEVSEQFPSAKLIPVSIVNDIDDAKAELMANALRNNIEGKKLVIAIADMESPNEFIAEFSKKFTSEILRTGSTKEFDNLPAKNKSAVKVFAQYLESTGSKKSSFVDNENQEAVFIKGESRGSNELFLVAFGDVMLGRHVRVLMDKYGLDYPFTKMDDNYLNNNDLLLANLEGPIAKKAIQTSKTIAFRFLPDVANVLKSEGFDVLGLANNHAYDMGFEGYDSTKEVLKDIGIDFFGDARAVNDGSFITKTVRGQKLAFIGLEEVVYKINDDQAVAMVKKLNKDGYKVIPFVHMGVEYQHKPNKRQTDFFHKLIDAGAYAIIAHHPHVVEGYENYNGHPIFYSLGNAVFDQYFSSDTQEGLSLAWNIEDDHADIYLMPFRIVKSQMQLMNADERKEFFKRFIEYSTVSDSEKEMIRNGKITVTLR